MNRSTSGMRTSPDTHKCTQPADCGSLQTRYLPMKRYSSEAGKLTFRVINTLAVTVTLTAAVFLHGCAATPIRVSVAEQEFRGASETRPFFDEAHGYAIFPSIGKAAVGIGGSHGNGVVYRGDELVGEARVTGLSAGFALGGQSYSELIFFSDSRALQEFCSGQFEFGANASAVAIISGASATAASSGVSVSSSTDPEHAHLATNYYRGMAVFTLTQGGLMYEASLGGQKFAVDCRL